MLANRNINTHRANGDSYRAENPKSRMESSGEVLDNEQKYTMTK